MAIVGPCLFVCVCFFFCCLCIFLLVKNVNSTSCVQYICFILIGTCDMSIAVDSRRFLHSTAVVFFPY